jgi:hypothetical protein
LQVQKRRKEEERRLDKELKRMYEAMINKIK